MTKSFEDIFAWQKAHQFVLAVYGVTRTFPESERYGLSSQFQRAAVSIPANIAEGYRRLGQADKLHFMNMAQASLEESRYYCILARDLMYIDGTTYELLSSRVNETSYLLNSYVKGIKDNQYRDAMD